MIARPKIILAANIVTAAFALHLALMASGFCYAKGRWSSNAELIEAAVRADLRDMPPQRANELRRSLASNPNCCFVGRNHVPLEGPLSWTFRLLMGQCRATVSLNYNPPGGADVSSPDFVGDPSLVLVSACGDARVFAF